MLALMVVLLSAFGTPSARAADKIYLTDGTVVEGVIKQDLDGYLWVVTKVGGVETEVIYKPAQIDKVVRDTDGADTPKPAATAARPAETQATPKARSGNVVRAAVLSLGDQVHHKDMVGTYMTAERLRRAIPLLEEELGTDGTGILVLRISSGGGMLLEIQKLSDVIEYELKPRFRVVAWIESAISAAAMTSHAIEEIYFTTAGHYGACTGWYGQLTAVKGRDLEDVLYMMEKISARGKKDPKIMRAMQINGAPLSCSIDEYGNVTWYQTEDGGRYLVSRGDKILTFNSQNALKYKFSKGTADTVDELARAMGVPEVEWVGTEVEGIPYPVSKAEEYMRGYRDQVAEDESRTREYQIRYQSAIALAQSTPLADRGKFVNKARQALKLIERMVKNNPNFGLLIFNRPTYELFQQWVREQEEFLRSLMR